MSLQDDIFDLQTAVEGKAVAPALERLLDHLNTVEARLEEDSRKLHRIEEAALVFKRLFRRVE